MKEIYIIKDFFEKSEEVFKFLKNKNCNVNLIEKKETLNLEKNKSTIVCSKQFQENIGGKSEILKMYNLSCYIPIIKSMKKKKCIS